MTDPKSIPHKGVCIEEHGGVVLTFCKDYPRNLFRFNVRDIVSFLFEFTTYSL
jgi:hypothetical protein